MWGLRLRHPWASPPARPAMMCRAKGPAGPPTVHPTCSTGTPWSGWWKKASGVSSTSTQRCRSRPRRAMSCSQGGAWGEGCGRGGGRQAGGRVPAAAPGAAPGSCCAGAKPRAQSWLPMCRHAVHCRPGQPRLHPPSCVLAPLPSRPPPHLDAGVRLALHGGGAVQAVVEGARVARLDGVADGGGIVLQPRGEQHHLWGGRASIRGSSSWGAEKPRQYGGRPASRGLPTATLGSTPSGHARRTSEAARRFSLRLGVLPTNHPPRQRRRGGAGTLPGRGAPQQRRRPG